MHATGLPIPTASPAPTTSTELAPPPTTSSAQAPTDFVLALAQMLGASAPATSEAQGATLQSVRDEAPDLDASDAAAALSLLPLAIAHAQPQQTAPQPAPQQATPEKPPAPEQPAPQQPK